MQKTLKMLLEGAQILASVKYNIAKFLLNLNISIGRKLSFLLAKYEADEYAVKNEKMDLRTIPARIKNVLLHDQDIIDKRCDECQKCEFLFKPTGSCKKCGCFMQVKTKISTASCPIGKWGKEYNFIKGEKVVANPAS